jgi:sugar/nucleoside kinase (ribokinase family)
VTQTEPRGTGDEEPQVDIFLSGTVFLDIVFTGMLSAPSGGHEVWTDGMGSSPGGVANLAVACSRLGLRTSLGAAFGGDAYGDFCWSTLADCEGIDLSHSRRFEGWHSPVTVSLAFDDDRAMVSHGHPAPVELEDLVAHPPASRLCFFDVGGPRPSWLDGAISDGSMVFADPGWDATGDWDVDRLREQLHGVHAFVPNADEAMAYTRTASPGAALESLRELVPLVVVTNGGGGAFGADDQTGETAWAPGVPVEVLDPTGAGDVFLAGLMVGTLQDWPLLQRLRFANLCAALSVRDFGGAMAAPGWGEVAGWWAENRTRPRTGKDYAFLDDVIPPGTPRAVSRAMATIGLRQLPPLPTPPSAVPRNPPGKETR